MANRAREADNFFYDPRQHLPKVWTHLVVDLLTDQERVALAPSSW